MFAEALLLATAFQVGPFYEQREDYHALRPFYATQAEETDGIWPLWTSHRDWWRALMCLHYQENRDGGYQFELMPIWFNGREREEDELYWGLFPIWGCHPHILLMYDIKFGLWPLWHSYKMPRRVGADKEMVWMESNSVLFPLFNWRSDGSWSFWPLYGISHNRDNDAQFALWPIVNWASYREDRDTAGAGYSWMVWPLAAHVCREREDQWMFLPPLFAYAETPIGWRGRYLWPIVEIERTTSRSRTSIFPLYEEIVNYRFYDSEETTRIYRFGWRIVEILPEEVRVFPFYVQAPDYLRIWPFWESEYDEESDVWHGECLSLFPIRNVPAVDRNWSKFWTLYERDEYPTTVRHSLLWGIISWYADKDDAQIEEVDASMEVLNSECHD